MAKHLHELLSPREQRVLELVTAGKTNAEIAAALDVSVGTVKLCLGQMMDRFQLHRRTQAAAFYAQHTLRSAMLAELSRQGLHPDLTSTFTT